mmetsp:Transcript_53857/g.96448  ORF Transcript_53857/g.96448 Transcript_53857/m.96448 type:complete len:388 (-) Transcript_53857:67-1230(-)
MANRTDPHADTVHGTNPQFLVDRIIRVKIYNDAYWKEFCFGLTTESVIDQASKLDYVGGTYGGRRRPSKFLCLFLKLLQIQPDEEVVMEYIKQSELKYLRALGAAYLRITARYPTVLDTLEPLYADYRKLRYRNMQGKMSIIHMDEFIDWLLKEETVCDVTMPQMPRREILEAAEAVQPYQSVLEDDLEDLEELERSVQDAKDAKEAAEAAVKAENLRDLGLLPRPPEEEAKAAKVPEKETETEKVKEKERQRSQERDKQRSRERERERRPRRSRTRSRSRRGRDRRDRSDSGRARREKEGRERSKAREGRREKEEGRKREEVKEVKEKKEKKKDKEKEKDKKEKKGKVNKADEDRAAGHAKKDKDGLSVEEWNEIRKGMGLKPLKG